MSSQPVDLVSKWAPILEHADYAPIKENYKKFVTANILENTVKAIKEDAQAMSLSALLTEAPVNVAGTNGFTSNAAVAGPQAGYDPVLISLIRRTMPNLIAYDIAGVQPMTGPAGMIFAMRAKYNAQSGNTSSEAFYNEADTDFAGAGTHAGNLDGNTAGVTTGTGMDTAAAEALGDGGAWGEMGISMEKVTVSAKSRALKTNYSIEFAQDFKAVHGLNAESELSNIMMSELLAETNREVVRTVYLNAVVGAAETANAGTFDLDVDANGRWSVEKFKGLMFQIEREANRIAKDTRRGKGNIVICSSDVASALQLAGVLDYAPALNSNALNVDDTGNTFAGVLNGRFRVYIDPYATSNYLVVGYKGANAYDAGLFYCPYVPVQLFRAVDPATFQPAIGMKMRYGLVSNPFAQGLTQGLGALAANSNLFYRRVRVLNLL